MIFERTGIYSLYTPYSSFFRIAVSCTVGTKYGGVKGDSNSCTIGLYFEGFLMPPSRPLVRGPASFERSEVWPAFL